MRKPAHSSKELRPIETVLKQSEKREWRHLAQERIEDVKPTIPLGEKFWSLSREEKDEIERLFATEKVRKLIVGLKSREDSRIRCGLLDERMQFAGAASLRGVARRRVKEGASALSGGYQRSSEGCGSHG
jgi:hypothetical protein